MPKVYKDFDRQTWTFTTNYNPAVYQLSNPDRLLNLELFWTFLDIFRGNKKACTILGAGIGYGTDAVLRTILEASTPQCEGIANSTNVKLSNLEEAPHIVLYFVLCLIPTIVKQLKTKQLKTPIVPRAGIEPARTFIHWCLRPTRLPIPPSGLVRLGTKILQLLKVIHRQQKRSTLLPTLDYFKRCPDCSSEGFEGAVC